MRVRPLILPNKMKTNKIKWTKRLILRMRPPENIIRKCTMKVRIRRDPQSFKIKQMKERQMSPRSLKKGI